MVETTAEEGGGATGTVIRIDRALRERPKVVLSSSGGLDGGHLLDLLGYERACHDLPADARRAADDIRARFAAEARERNWRLPELW